MRSTLRATGWVCVWVLCCAAAHGAAGDAKARPDAKPPPVPKAGEAPAVTFEAGKEAHIDDPQTGGAGFYLVYVPKDYTPDRPWPIIYCYHGMNQKPTTFPFRNITDGKGFIVVGMEYTEPALGKPSPERDLPNLRRIAALLSGRLKIDNKLAFIGGFSQGGWETSSFAEHSLDLWAGVIILGAGRASRVTNPNVRGMPIFIGAGETDANNKPAKAAAEYYRGRSAEVTFEEFKGIGHAVDQKNAALRDWLLDHGPRKQAKLTLEHARQAEKAGKAGEAHTLFKAVTQMPGAGEAGAEADKSARAIEEAAQKKLSAADQAVANKQFAEAAKLYAQVQAQYAGSTLGEQARQKLQQFKTDPAIAGQVEQSALDARADALEAQAQAAEAAKDYGRALSLYERYVSDFAKATRFAQVKSRLDTLKADKTIVAAARNKQADGDCRSWMTMAENYIANGLAEKAKPYLQRIVDTYGDTDWGAKARKRLAEIGG